MTNSQDIGKKRLVSDELLDAAEAGCDEAVGDVSRVRAEIAELRNRPGGSTTQRSTRALTPQEEREACHDNCTISAVRCNCGKLRLNLELHRKCPIGENGSVGEMIVVPMVEWMAAREEQYPRLKWQG